MPDIEELKEKPWVKAGLKLNFESLEEVEISLLDFAHNIAMLDDPGPKAQGRALKAIVPAWIAFLKEEQDRNEENGPGNAVYGMVRAYAMLSALTILPLAKGSATVSGMTKSVLELYEYDVNSLIKMGRTDVEGTSKSSAAGQPWHPGRSTGNDSGNKGRTRSRKVG